MSPAKRQRKPGRVRPSNRAKHARRSREPKTELDRLLDNPNGLANADPLKSELAASGIIASWEEIGAETDTRDEVLAAVIVGFGQRGKRNQLALLHAMLPMLDPGLAREARAAIEAIRARGHADPLWAELVGRPTLIDATARTDVFGDVTVARATFQHDGWPPHTINLVVDHTFHNAIREVAVTRETRPQPESLDDAADRAPAPMDGQGLATLLWRGVIGLEYPDLRPDVEPDEDVAASAPLLRARLKVLPQPRYERGVSTTVPQRKALVREFIDASWPDETPSARLRSPRLRTARRVAAALVEFGTEHAQGDPLRCTPATLAACLIEALPIELGSEGDPDLVLRAVRAWVRFTERRTRRPKWLSARLLAEIDALEPAFRRILAEMAGPARTLASAMLADGVDLLDRDAVQAWIDRFNRLPVAQRDRILGPL